MLFRNLVYLSLFTSALGCSSMDFRNTVHKVEINKFMKKWYVIKGRTTIFEKDAYNSTEEYTWNSKENRIDIDFTYNKGSLEGKEKSIPQKAWIENDKTNAHWKVSPLWPLRFDYLIIGLADDYSWTAIGVPSGKYLWIMAASPDIEAREINKAIEYVESIGYPTQNLKTIHHKK